MADRNRQRRRLRVALAVGLVLLSALALSSVGVTTPAGDGESRRSASLADSGRQSAMPPAFDHQTATTNRTGRAFDATVFRDIAGQVAVEDGTVAVRGTATGTDEVLVALFDRRGRVATELVSVGDDGAFDEADLGLVADDGRPLGEGVVVATVLSPGRDGQVGDGEVGNASRADLTTFAAAFRETVAQRSGGRPVSRTQRQLVELYYDQTVEDAGSDDLLLAEEFVYTDARTTVERVIPRSASTAAGVPNRSQTTRMRSVEPIRVGDALVVRGLTNRRPADNSIFVEVVEGPSADAFDLAATETWGTDGVWEVELDASAVEPGVYTIEAEDGESSDSVQVRILPQENEAARTAGRPRGGVVGVSRAVVVLSPRTDGISLSAGRIGR